MSVSPFRQLSPKYAVCVSGQELFAQRSRQRVHGVYVRLLDGTAAAWMESVLAELQRCQHVKLLLLQLEAPTSGGWWRNGETHLSVSAHNSATRQKEDADRVVCIGLKVSSDKKLTEIFNVEEKKGCFDLQL